MIIKMRQVVLWARNSHAVFSKVGRFSRYQSTSTVAKTEYAFQMTSSTILRFGPGATSEIGFDLSNLGARNTMVLTDATIAKTSAFQSVADALTKQGIKFNVFDKVRCEPTDTSVQEAIDFARRESFDSFVAVGGGSTIDTAKAAALLAANPQNDLFDFVSAPDGKAQRPANAIAPLIAIPTTAGTGSEMSAATMFDIDGKGIKAGIRDRSVQPYLAIVDPVNTQSMPRHVTIYSGFDVLCHAIESYIAKPFVHRPVPLSPTHRPHYQGSNPVSDVWTTQALDIAGKYFLRSVADPLDLEARSQMHLAGAYAGMGFNNAGTHICHAMSYPISGQVKEYISPDYNRDIALVPHGLSVVMTACADFRFTAATCPQRHLEAARLLGADISMAKEMDAGEILGDRMRYFLREFGVPNGLGEIGFGTQDIESLAQGAMESNSLLLKVCPRELNKDDCFEIYERSMSIY